MKNEKKSVPEFWLSKKKPFLFDSFGCHLMFCCCSFFSFHFCNKLSFSIFSFFSLSFSFLFFKMAAEDEKSSYKDPLPLSALHPTSRVIKIEGDDWTFDQEAYLIPHEALRVATERVARALVFYNPEKCPWKTERVRAYLLDYYLPAVHEHHDNEELIFLPFYTKLGVEGERVCDFLHQHSFGLFSDKVFSLFFIYLDRNW